MVSPGVIVAGRYEAGRPIGQGTTGIVFQARHLELETSVAIKVLREELVGQAPLVERFLRGAKATAQLRDEHVCRVFDSGKLDDGSPFMVMELLAGCDLAKLLEQTGPMPAQRACTYVVHACSALAEAHALGIVHRDLKPSNLFRTRRPDGAPLVKIVDFGLGKSINGQDLSLTQTQNVMGSPAYMAPEQLRSGKNVDARSDVWSLGVVLYELVVGVRPFRGANITELALAITSDEPPAMPAMVPAELAATIVRCLQKDAGARFQSMAELAAALEPLTKGEVVGEEPPEPPEGAKPSRIDTQIDLDLRDTIPTPPKPVTAEGKPVPLVVWMLVAGISAIIGAVAMYLAQHR